eukprot:3430483-Alexandrium_andersonii.AAC.1
MSASLVGSEMCIRDSRFQVLQATSSSFPKFPAASNNCHRSEHVAGHLGAVSYTHLTLPTICSV